MEPEQFDDRTPMTPAIIKHWARNPSDPMAFEALAVYYTKRLEAWCMRHGLQRADAQDLAQELLLKIRAVIDQYHPIPGKPFRAWLKTVTFRECMNHFRAHQRYQEFLADLPPRQELEEEILDDLTRIEALRAALAKVQAKVAPKDWEIFQRTALDEPRPRAAVVAAERGISVLAVNQAKHRVLKKLKDELGDIDPDGEVPEDLL
jgi:RNA polymerase sigma-70 factor (ECF subfamily)